MVEIMLHGKYIVLISISVHIRSSREEKIQLLHKEQIEQAHQMPIKGQKEINLFCVCEKWKRANLSLFFNYGY